MDVVMENFVRISPPVGFSHSQEAAGCFCECDGRLLFVKRHPSKSQGNTWGVPGGKLEPSETHRMAVIREVREETGIDIGGDDLTMLGTFYCCFANTRYLFHVFRKPFVKLPSITLALEEHLEARWVTVQEALGLPLVAGTPTILDFYQERYWQ